MIHFTEKQLSLWRLRRDGLSISEIASKLGISRQAVHKGLQSVDAKIYRALTSAAASAKIEIKRVDVEKGLLIGWSPWLKSDVYMTFSAKNGVQMWFEQEKDCGSCPFRSDCLRILREEAEERGIELPKDEEPSRLAKVLFQRLLGV